MDKTKSPMENRLEEANGIYEDIREFFESEQKTMYLATAISLENVEKVLEEIEEIFVESESFEKCAQIAKWKEQLKAANL
jgi:hypothetical protein